MDFLKVIKLYLYLGIYLNGIENYLKLNLNFKPTINKPLNKLNVFE